MHTHRVSDTPYALHICVRNRPGIEHDLFIAPRVKSNQSRTKAGKKAGLRLGSDPHLIWECHYNSQAIISLKGICRYKNAFVCV